MAQASTATGAHQQRIIGALVDHLACVSAADESVFIEDLHCELEAFFTSRPLRTAAAIPVPGAHFGADARRHPRPSSAAEQRFGLTPAPSDPSLLFDLDTFPTVSVNGADAEPLRIDEAPSPDDSSAASVGPKGMHRRAFSWPSPMPSPPQGGAAACGFSPSIPAVWAHGLSRSSAPCASSRDSL